MSNEAGGSTVEPASNGPPAANITSGPVSQPESTIYSVQFSSLSLNEQDSIVNVTREYPFDYATVMFGYIMPFVLVLTLITNTLVVMVLAQRHMRTPTNIVLFTMAIVDLMTLLSPSPWYFYIYTLGYHDKFLYPPIACYAHHIMTDVIPVFFHTSSIWLALLLASQRYIYVCHPTLARTWCTVPRVRKAIIIILVTAFLHQLTRFFDNIFVPIYIQYDQGHHLACKNEIADWVHKIDIALYYTTYYTFRILFVFIIPCVALITLNYLLFRALRRAENKRTELLKTKFKLVSGNHCSVAGFEPTRESSYMANNSNSISQGHRRHVNNSASGPNCGLIMPIQGAALAVGVGGGGGMLSEQRTGIDGFGKQSKCIKRRASSENSDKEESDDEVEEEDLQSGCKADDDDDSICPECAGYERHATDAGCQRCSAATDDGVTCDWGEHLHKPISQCSSLMGSDFSEDTRHRGHLKCAAACSSSDPCINCNQCAGKMGPNGSEPGAKLKGALASSQSDYGDKSCRIDVASGGKRADGARQEDYHACENAIATTTTTVTTTATLYSANTNSVGSLLQVQGGGQQLKRQGSQLARIKNPSFASTTGRGSRATLVGGGPSAVPALAGAGSAATTPASSRTMDSNRTTLMLIVVVTVFLMVEVPVAIMTILHVILNTFDVFKDVEFESSLNYIKLFTNFFIMISYSVNFTIYCSMSKKFRETFRDLFLCGQNAKRKRAQRLLYQNQHSQYIGATQLATANQLAAPPAGYNLTNNRCNTLQNNLAITIGSPNNNINAPTAGVMRLAQYGRANSQQQECEL